MKTYAIPSAGLEVSSVVLGLMRIASMASADIDRLVRTAIDEGVTVFDHADVYGGDHLCERRFGEAVKLTAAERDDKHDGRVYTLAFTYRDPGGNAGSGTCRVVARRSPVETAVDSGAQRTVDNPFAP